MKPLLLVLLAACAVAPRPPPAPPRETKLGLELVQFTLDNGLRVAVVRDATASDVHVTMRYRVGGGDDPAGQAGMAHLVEHVMFQQVLGASTVFAKLETIATSFNAFTTHDATTYVTTADTLHLDELLSIEAVRLGLRCTSVGESAFEREREVVVNELHQGDDARDVWSALYRGVYPEGHPYHVPVIGTEASIRAITREQACAFADRYYAPGNAVLVISGPVAANALKGSLGRFFGPVAKRPVPPQMPLPDPGTRPHQVAVDAPIDDDALLLAWSEPADPLVRAKLRALASSVAAVVDAEIKGSAASLELGDVRGPMIGIVIAPAKDETVDGVTRAAHRAVDSLATQLSALQHEGELGKIAFDRIQQSAIYELFAELEDRSTRDTRLAAYVIEGRDPSTSVGRELQGLREMTAEEAAITAHDQFNFDKASIVVLHGTGTKKRGHHIELAAAIHDLGRRRDPPDPAEAHAPLPASAHANDAQVRTLPNGLAVVLVPTGDVPTVDVRLVFTAGTADDPEGQRGVALLAGKALRWDLTYINDLLALTAAGGRGFVDVGVDATTFEARGLDMHLDYLLAGLRRWVRDGRYEAASIAEVLRDEDKRGDDVPLTTAWQVARYGADHPYAGAGTSAGLSPAAAATFRAGHFTPDNATLIIAGHFDTAIANKWIDFLFGDWTGKAIKRDAPAASPQPGSLARERDTTQLSLSIALPATAGSRGAQLVAAQMLDELAGDVRHQLGATYGLHVYRTEQRLATDYVIQGRVDAPRAKAAVELLRTRIDALRTDADAAARAFVIARERARTQLVAPRGIATALAADVAQDIAMHRAPRSDLATANEVEALTIDAMAPTLAELDLARATIAMAGPREDIDAAYAALGRTATYVDAPAAPSHAPAAIPPSDAQIPNDIADALTLQTSPVKLSLALGVNAGYTFESVAERDASGIGIGADVGLNIDEGTAVGLHLGFGYLTGAVTVDPLLPDVPVKILPLSIKAYGIGTTYERFWGKAMIGLQTEQLTSEAPTAWHTGLGLDLLVGVDGTTVDRIKFGMFIGSTIVVGGDVSSFGLLAGLSARR